MPRAVLSLREMPSPWERHAARLGAVLSEACALGYQDETNKRRQRTATDLSREFKVKVTDWQGRAMRAAYVAGRRWRKQHETGKVVR